LQPKDVNVIYYKIHNFKYQRSTTSDSKDIELRTSEFEAKTLFLLLD